MPPKDRDHGLGIHKDLNLVVKRDLEFIKDERVLVLFHGEFIDPVLVISPHQRQLAGEKTAVSTSPSRISIEILFSSILMKEAAGNL